ncbi:hypothetical protein JVT61DRAFT_13228 [Boletus reticuloceps]|uniref:Uncharacterized protein n=1 Tax=Boletus reticuloceps TaxID=495285 RepID=A0A8I2YWH3_9AGAM|nr:hypothetical protein JVT61DRAFT_13228 [Boletus reticuloceps]
MVRYTKSPQHALLIRSAASSEANNAPHAPLNLVLAKRHYSARLIHLRDLIAAEEVRFKRIVAEINEIRSGAWDDKIRANLVGNSDANPSDVAGSQSPQEPISEPPQESVTVDLSSTDDQATLRDTTEREDAEIDTVDDATEQPPVEEQHLEVPPDVSPDVPVDIQITRTTPVAEDVVREPTPADYHRDCP